MERDGDILYEIVSKVGPDGKEVRECIICEYAGKPKTILYLPARVKGIEATAIARNFWSKLPKLEFLSFTTTVRNICLKGGHEVYYQPSRDRIRTLKEYYVPDANPVFHTDDGVLFLNGPSSPRTDCALYCYPPGKAEVEGYYSSPKGCTSLMNNCFAEIRELQVVRSDALKVGKGVFRACRDLEAVVLPSAKEIGNAAFRGCGSLERVMVPAAEYIGLGAFEGCEKLKIIQIGSRNLELRPDMFNGCRTLSMIEFTGSADGRYCNHNDMVFSVWEDGVRPVYCYKTTRKSTITIPSYVDRFSTSIFNGCRNVREVFYSGNTECVEDCNLKIKFTRQDVPDKTYDVPLENGRFLLYVPGPSISNFTFGDDKMLGRWALRDCQHIEKLNIVRSSLGYGDLIRFMKLVRKVDNVTGMNLLGIKKKDDAIYSSSDLFICMLAGSTQNHIVCKGFYPDCNDPPENISTLVVTHSIMKTLSWKILDKLPKLRWLIVRTDLYESCRIPLSERYHTIILNEYCEPDYKGEYIKGYRVPRRHYEYEITHNLVYADYTSDRIRQELDSESVRKKLSDEFRENKAIWDIIGKYIDGTLVRKHIPMSKRIEQSRMKTSQEPETSATQNVPRHASVKVTVPARKIIIVTQKFRCIREGHTLEDVTIKVRMLAGSSLSVIDVPAGYCRECGSYYVYSSVFDDLIGSRMRPGVEILQNRFKMPDGGFYGSIYETTGTLQSESLLKRCGYTVGITAGLSDRARITLLRQIIDMELMTKQEVMSYLNYFISFNGRKSGNEVAKMDWEHDLMEISRS